MKPCIKKFIKLVGIDLFILLIPLAIIMFTSGASYVKMYFNKDIYDKYASYYNVLVEIKDNYINGKLNKYISIKHKNNICYAENCGFAQEGEYKLASIQFYEIDGKAFVFKSCLLESNLCFYNISEDFINGVKERKQEEFLSDIRIYLILFLFYVLIAIIYSKIHQKKLTMEQEDE